jgi:hydroxyacylglutathione hydrolase
MLLERIRSEGIAHISYLVGSDGIGAVIDPRRDCDEYLQIAREEDIEIELIFETHKHEDFVTGSLELSNGTGGEIYHGSALDFKFGRALEDGQSFELGGLSLRSINTPGHTDESISLVLAEAGGENLMVFTGDALFVGDVGRTDFMGPAEAGRLAGELYDSIHGRILPLGDGVILCPAHGAGSVCGSSINVREESTLGLERKLNPKLKMDRDEFIRFKSTEVLPKPPYFSVMERYNIEGPPSLGQLPVPSAVAPPELKKLVEEGAIIVDTRFPPSFSGAHIPGSLSIWFGGLPTVSGWVIPHNKPIVLVLANRTFAELATRFLVRLGYDDIRGYLCSGPEACGLEAWYVEGEPFGRLGVLSVHEFKNLLDSGSDLTLLDVRSEEGWREGHIPGSMNIYSGHLEDRMGGIPRDKPVVVVCNVGNRATHAASLLKREGFEDVSVILGGMIAWNAAGYPQDL